MSSITQGVIIVLDTDPSLLYLIGDPEDPAKVWTKVSEQFQKKMWANKLSLRKKLFTMKLSDGGSMRQYVKAIVEEFNELAVVAEAVTDEDKVIYLLAGLESVTERLLREEQKLKSDE